MSTPSLHLPRRTFIKSAAALTTLAALGKNAWAIQPGGSDKIKVGLIGCGGRGTEAARQCVNAGPNIELYALGDFFADKTESTYNTLDKGWTRNDGTAMPGLGAKLNVTKERMFTGFDAYKQVIASGVDVVILATQPAFRPLHLRAAVEAGKHAFIEKPVSVDPVGTRSIIESARLAKEKGLTIVSGTQRRHAPDYLETLKRIQDGQIGELVGGQCYWMWDYQIGERGHEPTWTEIEYQIRNWYHFSWGSGDHICEQHIHNIDVMNWAFGGPPVKAVGVGGRITKPLMGNIYDHFSVEFEYANGARVQSTCCQIPGGVSRVGERLVGTKGVMSKAGELKGEKPWRFEGAEVNSMEQEHVDMIASIRGTGPYLNEGERVAESTLTAILGRMAAYTGREVSFKWALQNSKLSLGPTEYKLGPCPVPPMPIPGKEPLV